MFGVILPAFHYPRRVPFRLFAFLVVYLFLFSSPVGAVTTTISNLPSIIGSDPFYLDVSITSASSGTNYLRVDFYKEGKWDELKKYCLDDVRITRDLYEYGKKHGEIYYLAPFGRRAVKVNWKEFNGTVQDVNLTLGI